MSRWELELLMKEEVDDDDGVARSVAGGEVECRPLRLAYAEEEGSGLVALLLLLVLNSGVLSLRMGLGRLGYCGGGSINNVCCRDGDFLNLQ